VKVWHRLLDAVLGTPVPAPGEVPAGVVIRSGRWIPAVAGILGSMRGPAAAVTLRRSIVVYPGWEADPKLLAHELVHVRQWQQDPLFPVKYALGSLRHGYWMNPYEVEARAEADRLFPPDPTPTPRHA
jgi:hypothetical protein